MYHSEYGQDKFVAELLGHKRDGTFVEFGALDGLLHSNSLYFERELGWKGLLIEANPDAFVKLRKNRPLATCMQAAIYDRETKVLFEKIEGSLYGWSGICATIEGQHWDRIAHHIPPEDLSVVEVASMPLASALNFGSGTDIDYMSIDVEGAEEKILRVFPFEKFNIDVLGVEDNFGNVELDAIIQQAGYQFLQKVGPDRMYRRVR